ncbi:pyridoxal phosphate-dependent aminotransferase [Microbaculum marinisediminis]|uniref:Histidinol-phosphate aminotransferase n=1 Tax=Microbaculum marinisediminis TaxID=2931392 RepID=A0AAW5R317_9HYPH|nr:histidinol-phosphate transaminase [Microbaculum sp. A6E488]MCT8974640.1 aminotransferase class I/II-fold pyridoxal phosphate-dependent enzyme [Microbaculum sp. A6E488]
MNAADATLRLDASDFPKALDHVAEGPEYTPGKMTFGGGHKTVYKLSSNESALGIGPAAVEAILKGAKEQHLYPDAAGLPLAEKLAEHHKLDPARVLVGPGSDTIISWIVRGWAGPGDEVVYSAHGFQSYRIRAFTSGAVPVAAPESELHADVDALLATVTPRTRIVFLANPNNPTGTYLPVSEIRRLRADLPASVMLVLDEAYAEFVEKDDYLSGLALADDWPENLIVTRTFSKFYSLAGLRVGWAYAPRRAMGPLSRLRGPFSVSKLGLDAAVAALEDQTHCQAVRDHNARWRDWLQREIRALGYQTTDSVGNFVLLKVPGTAGGAPAFDQTLQDLGFVGRLANQNALPDWLRITVGSEEANQALIPALRNLVNDFT